MSMGERTRGNGWSKLLCQYEKLRNRMNPWLELGNRKTQVERLSRQEFRHRYQSDWDCTHPRANTKIRNPTNWQRCATPTSVPRAIIIACQSHDYGLNSVALVDLRNTVVDPPKLRAALMQYRRLNHFVLHSYFRTHDSRFQNPRDAGNFANPWDPWNHYHV